MLRLGYQDEITLHLAAEKLSSHHVGDRCTDQKLALHRRQFFYPEICRLCENERATATDGYAGAKCWTQVRFIRPPFCERCGLPF